METSLVDVGVAGHRPEGNTTPNPRAISRVRVMRSNSRVRMDRRGSVSAVVRDWTRSSGAQNQTVARATPELSICE
jgi:hypothetical protein